MCLAKKSQLLQRETSKTRRETAMERNEMEDDELLEYQRFHPDDWTERRGSRKARRYITYMDKNVTVGANETLAKEHVFAPKLKDTMLPFSCPINKVFTESLLGKV